MTRSSERMVVRGRAVSSNQIILSRGTASEKRDALITEKKSITKRTGTRRPAALLTFFATTMMSST